MKRKQREDEEEVPYLDQPAFVIPTKRTMYIVLGIISLIFAIKLYCEVNHVGQTPYEFYYTQEERRQGYPEYEIRWR